MVDHLAYRSGTLSRSAVEQALNKLLQDVPTNSILRRQYTDHSLDPETIKEECLAIKVVGKGMGVDPGTTLLVSIVGSSVGGVMSGLILRFIDSRLVPLIREQYGQDAIEALMDIDDAG